MHFCNAAKPNIINLHVEGDGPFAALTTCQCAALKGHVIPGIGDRGFFDAIARGRAISAGVGRGDNRR
jgi:hypothetical protein